jgi:hypothetical protein
MNFLSNLFCISFFAIKAKGPIKCAALDARKNRDNRIIIEAAPEKIELVTLRHGIFLCSPVSRQRASLPKTFWCPICSKYVIPDKNHSTVFVMVDRAVFRRGLQVK